MNDDDFLRDLAPENYRPDFDSDDVDAEFAGVIARAFRLELEGVREGLMYFESKWGIEIEPVEVELVRPVVRSALLLDEIPADFRTPNTHEVLVDVNGDDHRGMLPRDLAVQGEGPISFSLSEPTWQFALTVLVAARSQGLSKLSPMRRDLRYVGRKGDAGNDDPKISILDALPRIFRESSLVITCNFAEVAPREVALNATLFYLAYHTDLAATPVTWTPDRYRRVTHGRGTAVDELAGPRRQVDPELSGRYLNALGAANSVARYLAFHQVLESKFEPLMNDFVLREMQAILTDPSFSLKSSNSVHSAARRIANIYKERSGELTAADERLSLKLTLQKFVDWERVQERLSHVPGYDEYLKRNRVAFSGGNSINFEASPEQLVGDVVHRVYETRNAIVHAKISVQNRYDPARDEFELIQEIPLVRVLAEEVIISTGEPLDKV